MKILSQKCLSSEACVSARIFTILAVVNTNCTASETRKERERGKEGEGPAPSTDAPTATAECKVSFSPLNYFPKALVEEGADVGVEGRSEF